MMKRWMKASLMLIFFFFLLIGCEKDQVASPEVKEDVNQSEEQLVEADDVATEDETTEIEAGEDEEASVEKQDGSENLNEEGQAAKPTQEQKSTSHEPSQQESTQSEKSPQQKTTKIDKPTESVTKQAQPKQSSSNGQKEPSEQPKAKEEVKVETPPAKEKPSTEPTKPQAEPEKPKQTVTITIVAPDVKGTIVPVTPVELVQGDTVLSITQKIVKERGIQLSVTGSKATAYVQGIDNLYEFDHGPLSGWEAYVNGKSLDKSAGIYGVQAGQAIEWRYTKNYME